MPVIPKSATARSPKRTASSATGGGKKRDTGAARSKGRVRAKLEAAARDSILAGAEVGRRVVEAPLDTRPAYESGVTRLEALRALPVEQRIAQMLDEYFVLQHGMSTVNWQALQEVQYKIALREENAFGEATRAFLALLEAKKVDLSIFKSLGDWRAAMAGQGGSNGQASGPQLSADEFAGLAADLAAQAPAPAQTAGYTGGLVVGATLGRDGEPGPDYEGLDPSGSVAGRSAKGLDEQLADKRLQAIG